MIKQLSKPQKPSKASVAREKCTQRAVEPKELYEMLKPQLATLVQEVAWIACVDSVGHVLALQEIGRGAVDHVEVEPREVFRPAIEVAAMGVILVHNHPSDMTEASDNDKELTARLAMAGQILGVPLLDHMIVGKSGFTSLAEKAPQLFTPPPLF
jgi:DNA repair protein RadC